MTLDYLDSNHVHAVTNANSNTYSYDSNGNQVTRHIGSDTFNLYYDAENRLVEVQKNNATIAEFTFDGNGQRVMSVMDGETIRFVGGTYEKKGSEVTKYYMAGAARVAIRKYTIPQNMEVEYMLGDHLGSTSITTDSSGALVSELRYKPWGEPRYTWTDPDLSTTPVYEMTKYTFTGQYSYDVEFGLKYYGARFYDSAVGRFVSADTVIPQEQGTQAWDRYSYVNNNPIIYRDPTGHSMVQGDGGCSGLIDCAPITTEQRIQAYMGGRNPNINEAIKLIVIYNKIETYGASASYDENLQDGGGIDSSGNIVVGPSVLRSADFLGSIIFHESVHLEQRKQNRSFANGESLWQGDDYGDMGYALNELEAYDRQMNDSRFDLTENDKEFLDPYRQFIYDLISWNPILVYRVNQGVYTLDDLPEICVTNPSDPVCKPYGPSDSGEE